MDCSYRIRAAPDMYHPDLDSSWLGGEVGYNNNNINHKVKPPRLCTDRLKVFRQPTRGATLSILETGHVSIEFLKKKGDQDRLVELLVISGDGEEISVEQWKTDTGDIEKTWKTFTYDSLPEKYWKKYSHVYRFVDLVKSKTAKVTMYSERAKGVLMENQPPNFEATFFHGPKIVMCGSEVHIKEDSGASLMFQRDSLNKLVNNYTLGLVQHATQMREQCVRLEASVMTVQAMSHNSEPLFPVTVGMRPSTSFCSSTSSNSGSIDLLSSPRFTHLHSSPSSGSQGHPASPPSSPGPHIDLRCLDSSRKHIPTSHPSSADVKTPLSPFRHVSTLEGRKFKRQLSDSSDSSYLHYSNSPLPTAQSNPDLCNSSPYVQNTEQDSVSRGLANSFSRTEMEYNQKILPETLSSSDEFRQVQQPFILPPSASPEQESLLCTPTQRSQTGCDYKEHVPNMSSREDLQGRLLTKENVPTMPKRETMVEEGMTVCSDTQSVLTSEMKKRISSADRDSEESDTAAVVRQTFVPYTGWASQMANGTIWIHYNEGTQLGVYRDQPEVVYEDQRGNRYRYLQSDNIPEVVRMKLEKLPMVIESLKNKSSACLNALAST
ncbi:hypothetical protein ACOMHN_011298 [Nucella lapillus]